MTRITRGLSVYVDQSLQAIAGQTVSPPPSLPSPTPKRPGTVNALSHVANVDCERPVHGGDGHPSPRPLVVNLEYTVRI